MEFAAKVDLASKLNLAAVLAVLTFLGAIVVGLF